MPGEYNVSANFNVTDLSSFNVGDDLRTNHFQEGGNDENQGAPKDPLHIPIGPITKARLGGSKKHMMG